MSVRAYKIINIRTKKYPTFNCWDDQKVMDLAKNLDRYMDGGELEFEVSELKSALEEERSKDKDDQDKDFIGALTRMIRDAKNDEYVSYYCY
jgi:hypothetical protein